MTLQGRVDDFGRALVPVVVSDPLTGLTKTIDAWIDTGFTGLLLLPSTVVRELNLARSIDVPGVLADGTPTLLRTYLCQIDWFGDTRVYDMTAGAKDIPLLGIRLLENLVLHIDYPSRTVSLTVKT